MEQGKSRFWQHTELTREHELVLDALDVRLPGAVWSEWIDKEAPRAEKPRIKAKRASKRSLVRR